MEFATLIDTTTFGTVRRYRQLSPPRETQILFVQTTDRLERLAKLLMDESLDLLPAARRLQFKALVTDGEVKLGVERPWVEKAGKPYYLVDIDDILDDACCRVIFFPPFYLVCLPQVMRETSAVSLER